MAWLLVSIARVNSPRQLAWAPSQVRFTATVSANPAALAMPSDSSKRRSPPARAPLARATRRAPDGRGFLGEPAALVDPFAAEDQELAVGDLDQRLTLAHAVAATASRLAHALERGDGGRGTGQGAA